MHFHSLAKESSFDAQKIAETSFARVSTKMRIFFPFPLAIIAWLAYNKRAASVEGGKVGAVNRQFQREEMTVC